MCVLGTWVIISPCLLLFLTGYGNHIQCWLIIGPACQFLSISMLALCPPISAYLLPTLLFLQAQHSSSLPSKSQTTASSALPHLEPLLDFSLSLMIICLALSQRSVRQPHAHSPPNCPLCPLWLTPHALPLSMV